jgi:hypothetical protein
MTTGAADKVLDLLVNMAAGCGLLQDVILAVHFHCEAVHEKISLSLELGMERATLAAIRCKGRVLDCDADWHHQHHKPCGVAPKRVLGSYILAICIKVYRGGRLLPLAFRLCTYSVNVGKRLPHRLSDLFARGVALFY